MITRYFGTAYKIVRSALRSLASNDLFRMAGATAFFTTFGLPAILMIIVRTLGVFTDRKTLGRHIGTQLRKILGDDSVDSLVQVIRSFSAMQHNFLVSIAVFTFLVFVATTLFKIIKSSINEIWNIKVRPGARFSSMLRSRGISVAVILLGGILFLSTEVLAAGQGLTNSQLQQASVGPPSWLFNKAVSVLISALWFYVLFTFLPDGAPPRKMVIGGAVITAILFNLGKAAIGATLSPGRVHSFYGASGAIVLLLLFVFYSSIILYFGAAIIRAWTAHCDKEILPKRHALKYKIALLEDE